MESNSPKIDVPDRDGTRLRRLEEYRCETGRFVPRYELLKRLLIDEILSSPPEREFLPFQEQLAARYRVSLNTVRRALAKLRRDGYIEIHPRTGSRILRRTVEAHRPVARARGFDRCVGVALVNNRDTPDHGNGVRWSLVNALERRFGAAGVRLVVYNLREDGWRVWSDPDRFERSLLDNRIDAFIFISPDDPRSPWSRLAPRLGGRRIFYAFEDFRVLNRHADLLRDGAGAIVLNHAAALRSMLEKSTENHTGAAVLTTEGNRSFSDDRAAVIADWARNRQIPFRLLTLPVAAEPPGAVPDDNSGYQVRPEAAEQWRDVRAGLGAAPLVFGSNDRLMTNFFRVAPPDPSCEYVGYDETDAPVLGISSFDWNAEDRAEALYHLYAEDLPTPAILPVVPRYIDRSRQSTSARSIHNKQITDEEKRKRNS